MESLRVLVVASPLTLRIVRQMLLGAPEISLCGTVSSGREALALLPILAPQVVCLSDQLTTMSSLELTREIMAHHACPILVLKTLSGLERAVELPAASTGRIEHSRVETGRDEAIFALLQAGAVDAFWVSNIVPAPDSPQTRQLIGKIKMVARVPVISRSPRGLGPAGSAKIGQTPLQAPPQNPLNSLSARAPRTIALPTSGVEAVPLSLATPAPKSASRVVAIGASTGGPQALLAVLSPLPASFSWPILCVQHISKGFLDGLIEWLDDGCRVKVKIGHAGETPLPGTVYFPEEDRHLELSDDGKLKLTLSPAVDGHRASATVLFESVARVCHQRGVAVLLTGMGSDGARGLKAVHDAHGLTFAQNQESCVVFGMPAAAIDLGAAQHILPPLSIAEKLISLSAARIA